MSLKASTPEPGMALKPSGREIEIMTIQQAKKIKKEQVIKL